MAPRFMLVAVITVVDEAELVVADEAASVVSTARVAATSSEAVRAKLVAVARVTPALSVAVDIVSVPAPLAAFANQS